MLDRKTTYFSQILENIYIKLKVYSVMVCYRMHTHIEMDRNMAFEKVLIHCPINTLAGRRSIAKGGGGGGEGGVGIMNT
jgi:hypothetical protein